ncbi:hypothetical protein [Rhodoferax sp.]|uniref:hypothetical protein n=1 Tax=Rhodoferax sp. TaxID=50421 RepID=UPI00374D716C
MINRLIATLALCSASALVFAQTTAPTVRLRGTIEKVEAGSITLKERSGEVIQLVMPSATPVSEVLAIALAEIKTGSFIGTAAMPQADGSQLALEVLVFPEAARGAGEGHYPWDLAPQSTMTNATVADLASSADGRVLTLKYKDGEKKLLVPASVPVVTFQPGDASLLVPGAKVLVNAQLRDGKPTALRVLAGRNGFAPPM